MIGGSVPTGSWARIVEILSRTSCAATSRSFSRKNCTTTSEMPSLVVDRSSSMPGDRVDDLFDRLGDAGLHLLDAGPLERRGDDDDRQIDVGQQIHAQPAAADQPQHDRRGDQHHREDGPLDAEIPEGHGIRGLRLESDDQSPDGSCSRS